jgi:ERCC4-related helicase
MKMIVDVKKALREQGYDSFHQFMLNFKDDKHEKYKKIPFRKEILQSEEFTKLEKIFGKEQSSNNHPKLLKLRELLVEFFRDHQNLQDKSKAMVFTGFKASALEIKNFLEGVKEVRPALFVGQSKTTATTS